MRGERLTSWVAVGLALVGLTSSSACKGVPYCELYECEVAEGESSGTGGETSAGTTETGATDMGTTGPLCLSSVECDPATPLCDGGMCVACGDAVAVSCADDYPDTPICDAGSGACVMCSSHEQCPGSACELDVGTCFKGTAIHVDGDALCPGANGSEASPFCTIADAVASVPLGAEAVVVIHESAQPYQDSIFVDGRTVAFVAASGETPAWQDDGDNGLAIRVDSASVFVHRLDIMSSDTGLEVNFGGTLYVTRSKIQGSVGRGLFVKGGAVLIENSFVGAGFSPAGDCTVQLPIGSVSIRYSTIVADIGIQGLCCSNGSLSSIRDSIVVTAGDEPEIDCPGIPMEDVFLEADAEAPFDVNWFVDFAAGDFSISPTAPAEFFVPLSTWATWSLGDPLVDIHGDPRIAIDGVPGYAGADVPN